MRTVHDFEIPLNPEESVSLDLYLPKQAQKSPLLIFQHGNKASKEYHSEQAKLAASWGFTSITVKQPNQGQWLENGMRLQKLTELLSLWPSLLKDSFDPKKIILVGHSFGGSAIAIAAGNGAPAKGLIFLDPALVHKSVLAKLNKAKLPSILLGADESVFKSRKRQLFFEQINGPISEISIKGATHNDAQFPNIFQWKQYVGLKPLPQEKKQRQFAAAIIAAAFSLAEGGSPFYFMNSIKGSTKITLKKSREKTTLE